LRHLKKWAILAENDWVIVGRKLTVFFGLVRLACDWRRLMRLPLYAIGFGTIRR